MSETSSWSQKLLSLLHIRSMVAGLDISDELVRLVYFDGKLWQLFAVRLPPGTMENGKMKDRAAFSTAMQELRIQSRIAPHNNKKKINVVVVLSSTDNYSKVFRLPAVEGKNLEDAIALNLQMASPSDASQVYASSQIVGRDESTNQLDILAAFMDRGLVDDLVDALFAVGFVAMAVEPKSLALTRVFREKGSGIDLAKSYIMASMDNTGLDFLIIRNGMPYFEYLNHWHDIANEKGELPLASLQEDIKASLRQVLNFYAQHWKEPLAAVILLNNLFPEEVEKTIAENFSFPVAQLGLFMGQPISSEWLVALGSSLKESSLPGAKTKEISFLGEALEDRFRAEQAFEFLEFWRVVFPAALAILVAGFIMLDMSFGSTQAAIQAAPGINLSATQIQSLTQLEASATAFNASVAMINNVETSIVPQSALLSDLFGLAGANGISINNLSVAGGSAPITLSATATSENDITTFKEALDSDPKIGGVNLPLAGIQSNPSSSYSFSVTFTYIEQ